MYNLKKWEIKLILLTWEALENLINALFGNKKNTPFLIGYHELYKIIGVTIEWAETEDKKLLYYNLYLFKFNFCLIVE